MTSEHGKVIKLARLLADVKRVYDLESALPRALIADLKRVYDLESVLPPALIGELKHVYETEASDESVKELEALGEVLKKWRKNCFDTLQSEFAKLPPDHPLKCPVSLYSASGHGLDEVVHTRTLAWLLDPKEKHGFKTVLLEALLQFASEKSGRLRVRGNDVTARPERPYHSPRGEDAGRMDVWVEGRWAPGRTEPIGRQWLLVIEAKIGASEGPAQLKRYDKEIKRWGDKNPDARAFRVFLTPKGDPATTSKENWCKLSFLKLANLLWKRRDWLKEKAGFYFLRYYIAGILADVLHYTIGEEEFEKQEPLEALRVLKVMTILHEGG